MAAEWILQAYAYDPAELAAFVGCGKIALAKKIARAAKELHDDDRLEGTLDEIVVEIAQRKLRRDHAMSYRIALEAIMNELGVRLNKRLTTYGLKERLDEVLAALGQKTLERLWKRQPLAFPTPRLASAVDWPIGVAVDAGAVAKAASEARALPKRAEIDARAAAAMKGDESFATDTADVVVALAQVVTKAAKKRTDVMVLIDGEQ